MTRFHLPRVPHAAFAVINPTVRLLLRSPASNPANLPQWAPGFFKSIANRDSRWLAETNWFFRGWMPMKIVRFDCR